MGKKNMFQTTNQIQMNTTKTSGLAASTSGNSIIPGGMEIQESAAHETVHFLLPMIIYIYNYDYMCLYIVYIYIYTVYIPITSPL